MKVSFVVLVFLPIFSFTQLLQENYYSNSDVGLSIHFAKEWKMAKKEEVPVFAYTSDKDIFISLSWVPAKNITNKTITQQTIAESKDIISNYFKTNGVKINELSVYKDKFSNYDCIVVVSNINDPRYLHDSTEYSRTIKFFHKNYFLNIDIMIPYSKFSNEKLEAAKKQLATIQLF